MKNHLKKRMAYLWTFELFNALVVFPGAYYSISHRFHVGWFSLVALGVVCTILMVGASFWFLKWRALYGSKRLYQPSTRRFYRRSKVVFGVVIPVLPLLFVVRVFVQQDVPHSELLTGTALMILAFLEYINYYFIQLSYDNRADLRYLTQHRRLKPAVMVRELNI